MAVSSERKLLGIPGGVSDCHTTVLGSQVIEGPVPTLDSKRLLAERPEALGLAVLDMPKGSAGREIPNAGPYEVLLAQANGSVHAFANRRSS